MVDEPKSMRRLRIAMWVLFVPAAVDTALTIGSFGFFFLLFLGFIRVMPSMSIFEVKETLPAPTAGTSRHAA